MTFIVRVRPAAETDVGRATLWYAEHAPEQVTRFIDEFEAVLDRIADSPMASRPIGRGSRSVHMKVFPHQVWFRVNDSRREIEVIAVVHDRQDRGGFAGRLT